MKIKSNPDKTILTIATGFTIIYYFTAGQWALIAAIILGLIGILSTYLSEKVEWAWMKLAFVLSLIMPNVLLSVVFFIFLVPIAWLAKLFGKKDPLLLKNGVKSTFVQVDRTFSQKSFETMW